MPVVGSVIVFVLLSILVALLAGTQWGRLKKAWEWSAQAEVQAAVQATKKEGKKQFKAARVQAVEQALEGETDIQPVTDMEAGVVSVLMAPLVTSRPWLAIDLCRQLFSNACVIALLFVPPPCYDKFTDNCTSVSWSAEGFFYCRPYITYVGKACFGATQSLLVLYLFVKYMINLGPDGQQQYFPGSLSNKLYKLIAKKDLPRTFTDGRVRYGELVLLSLRGQLLFYSLCWLAVDLLQAAEVANCPGVSNGPLIIAISVYVAGVTAALPEIYMYYLSTLVTLLSLGPFYWVSLFCPCIRSYDERDKNSCCGGRFDIRKDPPETQNCLMRWWETKLFWFLAWFYYHLEAPFAKAGSLDRAFVCFPFWMLPRFAAVRNTYDKTTISTSSPGATSEAAVAASSESSAGTGKKGTGTGGKGGSTATMSKHANSPSPAATADTAAPSPANVKKGPSFLAKVFNRKSRTDPGSTTT